MTDEHERINEEQPGPLDGLNRELAPPPALEDRVVSALASRGLLAPASQGRAWIWRAAAAVLAAAIFFGGYAAGKKSGQSPVNAQPAFVLFLHEDAGYQQPTAEQLPQRIAEYGNWARELRQAGVGISGTKLRDDLYLSLASADSAPLRQPPGETVAGYFIISAKDLDEALRISRKCPHLRYGGRIEIRQIHPV